jgi:hypothetical protein
MDAETTRWVVGGSLVGTWALLAVIVGFWWTDSSRLWSAVAKRVEIEHENEKEAWNTYATAKNMNDLFTRHERAMEKFEHNIEAKLAGMESRIGDMIVYLRRDDREGGGQ